MAHGQKDIGVGRTFDLNKNEVIFPNLGSLTMLMDFHGTWQKKIGVGAHM